MYAKVVNSLAQWLCPTEFDRKRAVDTSERVRRARVTVGLLIGSATLLLVPQLGWLPLAFFAVQFAYLAGLDGRMDHSEHPEIQAAAGMLSTGIAITAAIIVTGGPTSPLLPVLALPIAFVAARFRGRVVLVGVALGVIAILAVAFAMDPRAVIDDPAHVLVAILIVAGTAILAVAIQGAEVQHRHESVIDPLTGLLNRKALETRFNEIEQQAHLSGGSVCLIELDLDHFKRINDAFGHGRGDAVLKDTAYEIRKSLRTFELVYRVGGEEFLIVLTGMSEDEGIEIAERIRSVVEETRPAGMDVTVSLGVAQASGTDVRFAQLYAQADEALYEAKRRGRNRVCPHDAAGHEELSLVG
jgi:diguanylate cyclase (GGDEF)-like protein